MQLVVSMTLLATANPDALQIGLWVVAATAVLQALASGLSVAKFILNRAERRQVTISPDVVARPDFDAHVSENRREHENLFSKLGGVERGFNSHLNSELKTLREERREDSHALHHEVNEVAKKVSSLDASNSIQSQRLAEISAKLDRVIERQTRP